jgi:hypothetical protein
VILISKGQTILMELSVDDGDDSENLIQAESENYRQMSLLFLKTKVCHQILFYLIYTVL